MYVFGGEVWISDLEYSPEVCNLYEIFLNNLFRSLSPPALPCEYQFSFLIEYFLSEFIMDQVHGETFNLQVRSSDAACS